MQYISRYTSPLGNLILAADAVGLTGLWFAGQRYFTRGLAQDCEEKALPIFDRTREWLEIYFSGEKPEHELPLHFIGTAFELEVWAMLCAIPYGKTTTYGEIANQLAAKRGIGKMSAQAVGRAVGHNRLSIIVPCHRVLGANGDLTGYAGGIERKLALLECEGIDTAELRLPRKNKII